MPDEKIQNHDADPVRRYFDEYNALRDSGKSANEALDMLGDGFEEMIRAVSLPMDDRINVINPDVYPQFINITKLLVLMGFDESDIDVRITGRFCLGHVRLTSDDMVFNRDSLILLNDILDIVGSVSLENGTDGTMRMEFTVPHVLKPL